MSDPQSGGTPHPDAALEARLEAADTADPRAGLRDLLRELRDADETAYRSFVQRFEDEVLAPLRAGTRDPLEAWLHFGCALAHQRTPGQAVQVNGAGAVSPLNGASDFAPGSLVLHLPEGGGVRALVILGPRTPSAPQRATLDLLVHSKVRLQPLSSDAEPGPPHA
jgi:hypothetical protein